MSLLLSDRVPEAAVDSPRCPAVLEEALDRCVRPGGPTEAAGQRLTPHRLLQLRSLSESFSTVFKFLNVFFKCVTQIKSSCIVFGVFGLESVATMNTSLYIIHDLDMKKTNR